jgi:4-amino-4-deoxy-L-arabinose transferase-like glycosyltransferase
VKVAAVVLLAGLLLRLAVAAWLPLVPDEAYYWEWSRNLATGYFDHPPAIAASIWLGTALFGLAGAEPSPLAVRLVPVLLGFVAGVAATLVAGRLGGERAALRAAVIISVLPLAATGLVLATPDAPLFATLSLGCYFVVRAVQSPVRSRASLGWWAATGIVLGLAFSSKYTAILFPIGVALAVVVDPRLRARLAEPGPYVACVLATIVFLPVLIWNSHHDWISFGFQLEHGLGRPRGSPLKRELDLLGGQLGLVTPILFVTMAAAVWKSLRRAAADVDRMLAILAVVCFGFFVVSAWRKSVEANWPAIAYIPGIALLAAHQWGGRWIRWERAGIWFAGVATGIIYLHSVVPILPIPARRDPVGRAFGWEAMAAAADRALRRDVGDSPGAARRWLGADRYQDAAQLAFNAAGRPFALSLNLAGRGNQYDLWPRFPEIARPGDDLVLVVDETDETHPAVARLSQYFSVAERGELVQLRRGAETVQTRRVWTLRGWMGEWPRASPP